ncbi:MAG: Rib/alpha-like domain-containing protein, partial [Streptococcus constellatus]
MKLLQSLLMLEGNQTLRESVTIDVYVKSGRESFTPEGKEITTYLNILPDPMEGIKDTDKMAGAVSTYTWVQKPNVSSTGRKNGVVRVTYVDNTYHDVRVPVKVVSYKDTYEPKGRDITTTVGSLPDPVSGIENVNSLPGTANITWFKEPDVRTVGNKSATISVAYEDGTVDYVRITVKVIGDSDKYAPVGKPVDTTLGKVPD